MNDSLAGKVAIITGAAQGIGAASAMRLANEGATVVVADLNEAGGQATKEAITAAGGDATFLALDVTDEQAWIDAIAQVRADHGALHILLNNAGIGRPAPLTELPQELFRLHFAINVEGMYLGMKHAIPLMTESGGGSIINLASTASRKPYANMAAYCASKAALAHLTKVAALECAQNRTGIRVNSIHPGIIKTPAWGHLGALEGAPADNVIDVDAMSEAVVAMGVAGVPDDIANAVFHLVSEASRYVTGSEVVVDGGQLLM